MLLVLVTRRSDKYSELCVFLSFFLLCSLNLRKVFMVRVYNVIRILIKREPIDCETK